MAYLLQHLLTDSAARRLPDDMLPDVVEFCEALTRTSTGKVDRARLAGHDR
jgi:acyl-CoA synthetase (AMP-forming)/AMP-acid ligase II